VENQQSEQTVVIIDADESHVEIYHSYLKSDGYRPRIFESISSFLEQTEISKLSLVLINYTTLLKSERQQVIHFFQQMGQKNIFVFNVPQNANKRLAFYELGARRVYDSAVSLEEVYYSIKYFIRAFNQGKDSAPVYSQGRLQDVSLAALLRMLGREARSGILKIYSEKNSGKLFFWKGHVDEAQVGVHRGLKAILHMFLWDKGSFVFSVTGRMRSAEMVPLSIPGLLILRRRILKDFEEKVHRLAAPGSVLRVKNLGDLKQAALDINPAFISFISQPRMLNEALENAFYTNYQTVDYLLQLKEGGFLQVHRAAEHIIHESLPQEENAAVVQIAFTDDEISAIQNNLFTSGESLAKVMVLSPDEEALSHFLKLLTGRKSTRDKNKMRLAQLPLNDDSAILLLGMKMNHLHLDSLVELSQTLAGYIFLLDGHNQSSCEYANYLISKILNVKRAPCVIAVAHVAGGDELQRLQSRFHLPAQVTWLPFDERVVRDIKDIILKMEMPQLPQKETEPQTSVAENAPGEEK